MSPYKQIPFNFDVSILLDLLNENPQLFGEYPDRTGEHSPHHGSTDIWVRYNHPDNRGESFNEIHFPVWYPSAAILYPVMGVCMDLMAIVGGEHLGGVIITKIPAGGWVAPHIDYGWHTEFYDKFYIPIQNDSGAKLCFEDGEIEPLPGEVYWFDNTVKHWVENRSNRDRIAIIICIRTMQRSLYEKAAIA